MTLAELAVLVEEYRVRRRIHELAVIKVVRTGLHVHHVVAEGTLKCATEKAVEIAEALAASSRGKVGGGKP